MVTTTARYSLIVKMNQNEKLCPTRIRVDKNEEDFLLYNTSNYSAIIQFSS